MPPSTEELSYLAGIIDGEGSIGLHGEYSRTLSLLLCIGNTDRRLIDWLHATFAGQSGLGKPGPLSRKPFWRWIVRGDEARNLLQAVEGYLKLKGEQARLGIEAWDNRRPTKGRAPLDAATRDLRQRYYLAMRELNGRLPSGPAKIAAATSRWETVTVPCVICSTPVERHKSRIKASGRALCSPECRQQWDILNARRMNAIRWGRNPE